MVHLVKIKGLAIWYKREDNFPSLSSAIATQHRKDESIFYKWRTVCLSSSSLFVSHKSQKIKISFTLFESLPHHNCIPHHLLILQAESCTGNGRRGFGAGSRQHFKAANRQTKHCSSLGSLVKTCWPLRFASKDCVGDTGLSWMLCFLHKIPPVPLCAKMFHSFSFRLKVFFF